MTKPKDVDRAPVHAVVIRDAARNACFRQGCDANDNNRRVCRNRRGAVVSCPYDVSTDQARWWNEGYQYRDMVNDG